MHSLTSSSKFDFIRNQDWDGTKMCIDELKSKIKFATKKYKKRETGLKLASFVFILFCCNFQPFVFSSFFQQYVIASHRPCKGKMSQVHKGHVKREVESPTQKTSPVLPLTII
jgi:hypothetical protein